MSIKQSFKALCRLIFSTTGLAILKWISDLFKMHRFENFLIHRILAVPMLFKLREEQTLFSPAHDFLVHVDVGFRSKNSMSGVGRVVEMET